MMSKCFARRMTVTVLAAAGLLLPATSEAGAQSCLGLPGLSKKAFTVSTIADAYGRDRSIVGRVGLTTSRFFGGIQTGQRGQNVLKPDDLVIGADVGASFKFGKSPKPLEFCPTSQWVTGFNGPSIRDRNTDLSLGLAIGQEFQLGSRFALAPFVDGALVRKGRPGLRRPLIWIDGSVQEWENSRWGTRYGAGFGLRVGQALTFRPAFHFTSGFHNYMRGNQPSASLSVTYNFGRR